MFAYCARCEKEVPQYDPVIVRVSETLDRVQGRCPFCSAIVTVDVSSAVEQVEEIVEARPKAKPKPPAPTKQEPKTPERVKVSFITKTGKKVSFTKKKI